jgi:septal ring factor EnvC (AmiA/AmiB activator)
VTKVRTENHGRDFSFLQVSESKDPKMKAVNLLRSVAKVTKAKALERLAQEIQAHLTGPFDEINQMVQKMIFRLMSEQKDEDDHKNWCDKELEKTDEMIENKENKIDELTAKLEEAKADVQELTEQIKDAEETIAEIETHMKEATDLRNEGKSENAISLKDSQDAQKALSNAIAVLTEFYKESGNVKKEEWEFMQRGVDLPEEPSTWDSGYTGVAEADAQPGGILTILEETSAGFAQMEADTQSNEAMDQKSYEEDMKDQTIEKARRTKESEMKTQEKKRLSDKIDAMTKSKKHTESELEATEQYLKDLQPACVEGDSSYEDRKAARAKEIEALKEVQGILTDAFKESASFLQRKKHA